MSLPSDTVTDDVKQLLLEDPAKDAGAINEMLTKIFQDFTYTIFKEEKLEKLLNDIALPKNIERLEVTNVKIEVWWKIAD